MKYLKVTEFTVSAGMDITRNGEKHLSFVSAKFTCEEPLRHGDFVESQLEASKIVSVAVVHDLLARGILTVEDANERISYIRDNTHEIISSIHKKREAAEVLEPK